MAETALTPIEIGLTAAIVGVEDGEPAILVAGDDEVRGARRAAVRSVRSAGASHLRDRPARLGRGADRPARRLRRAALHVRRSRPPCRARRCKPHMVSVGYLALTRIPSADRAEGGRRRLRAVVSLLPVGGLAQEAPRDPRRHHPPARPSGPARRMASSAARSAGASGCGFASASAARRGTRRRCSTATRCSTRPA